MKMDDGSTITGMVYIMDPRMDFGNPSAGYYDIVHRGYEDCGLDRAVKKYDLSFTECRFPKLDGSSGKRK